MKPRINHLNQPFFCYYADHFPIRQASTRYGTGSGEILLDNLICSGNEPTLLNCSHNTLKVTNCAADHSEDAGVVCGGKLLVVGYVFIHSYLFPVVCEDGYVRLINDTSDNSAFFKDTVSRGRVEICINGTFQAICEENWSNTDASVLCSELGFSAYGKLPG